MSITPAGYEPAPSLQPTFQPTFEEGLSVKRKAVLLALTTAVAVVVWQNYPDLVRYIKISQM